MGSINQTKLLEQLTAWYEESAHYTKYSRALGIKTREYYDGNQLSPDIIAELNSRPQPLMWENIIMKIGNKVAGIKDATKMEMRAYRVKTTGKATANVFTNIIRSTHDFGEFAAHKSAADFDLMIAGISCLAKKVKPMDETDMFGHPFMDISDTHISFEHIYADPFANKPDYSDARHLSIVKSYTRQDLERMFDKKKVALLDFQLTQISSQTYGIEQEQATVATTHYREKGKIKWAIWGKDVLLSSGVLAHDLDRFPYALRYANKRNPRKPGQFYGMFRNVLPLQDKINNAHLRIANMLGSEKLLFESDAVEDATEFADQYALDNAIVEVRPGAIKDNKIQEIKLNNKMSALMDTITDSRRQAEEIVGLNAEMLGQATSRLSGYAIESRQNSGLVGLQQFMTASMERDKDSAEMTIKLAQQYIKAEQVYRFMDKHEADAYFVVNAIERDESGRVLYEGGEPKRRDTIEAGHYAVHLVQEPQGRGNIADRQKAWVEIGKSLPEELRMKVLPMMLRDTESTVADEVGEIVATYEKQQSQGNPQQEAMMAEMQKKMALLDAKINDFNEKATENKAQAQLHLAKAEEIRKGDGDAFVNE